MTYHFERLGPDAFNMGLLVQLAPPYLVVTALRQYVRQVLGAHRFRRLQPGAYTCLLIGST